MGIRWRCVEVGEEPDVHSFIAGHIYEEDENRNLHDGDFCWNKCECESAVEWLQKNCGIRFVEVPDDNWKIDKFQSGDVIVYENEAKEYVVRGVCGMWDVRLPIVADKIGRDYSDLHRLDENEMCSPAFGKIAKVYRPTEICYSSSFGNLELTHKLVWKRSKIITKQEALALLMEHLGVPVEIIEEEE